MATQHIDLTSASATDVSAALSLAGSTEYTLQALGGPVYFVIAASAPDLNADPPRRQRSCIRVRS